MKKALELNKSLIAAVLLLTACSKPATTDWIGVVDSSVDPPYADFATESATFKTFADCEAAMKAAAGEQKESPRVDAGLVVRTLFYRCRQGKEKGKSEMLIGTKHLVLPAKQ